MNKNFSILLIACSLILNFSCKKSLNEAQTDHSRLDSLNKSAFIGIDQAKSYALSLNRKPSGKLMSGSFASVSNLASRMGTSSETNNVDTVFTVKDRAGINAFYIINFKPNGFCIVSADERAPSLLAYSETASFNKDNGTEGILSWMNDVKHSIENIRANQFAIKPTATSGVASSNSKKTTSWVKEQLPATSDVAISSGKKTAAWVNGQLPATSDDNVLIEHKDPLVQTYWGQGDGYNDQCDYMSCGNTYATNGRAVTGCVATAIAQIAAYHQFPSSYNWSSMSNYYGTPETARLMHNIGVAVDMDYKCDGSGTNGGTKTVDGFNLLGYSMSKREFKAFSATDPTNDFLNELRANRPFIISGGRKGSFIFFDTYKGGHEWVCDGFYRYEYTRIVQIPVDDYFDERVEVTYPTYFHMNWGWNGSYNGWYMVGDFGPTITNFRDVYRDDFEGTYNYKNIMYYNIKPL